MTAAPEPKTIAEARRLAPEDHARHREAIYRLLGGVPPDQPLSITTIRAMGVDEYRRRRPEILAYLEQRGQAPGKDAQPADDGRGQP